MPTLTKYQNDMRKNDHVQSILFSNKYYNIESSCAMARHLGYNCFYVDTTKNYYRVRQFNPGLNSVNGRKPLYIMDKSLKYPGVEFVIELADRPR